jgi:hypothetical protein
MQYFILLDFFYELFCQCLYKARVLKNMLFYIGLVGFCVLSIAQFSEEAGTST